MPKMMIKELTYWINERYSIYLKKKAGEPRPWTDDPILQRYRFCNVFRELDIVTIWIRKNWREPNISNPDMWFAMAVARLINWPNTLSEIGFPVPWKPEHFVDALENRMKYDLKVFTGAYMISCVGGYGSKARYLANRVLTPLWKSRKKIRPKPSDTLATFYDRLIQHQGMGRFMAGQVIADTKFTDSLADAKDWWSWAISGPGSRRGLNRVLYRNVDDRWQEFEWKNNLDLLHREIKERLKELGIPRLSASDFQSCLCELDKWCRVKNGEGRPRSLYPGEAGSGSLFENKGGAL